jgi:hypothetical protein
LQLRYMHANGEAIQPAQITQGTDFIAELRVTNTGTMGDLTYLALTQMVPSGWEILNSRFLNTQTADGSSEVDYEDIRDDRVMRYFSLRSGQTKVFICQQPLLRICMTATSEPLPKVIGWRSWRSFKPLDPSLKKLTKNKQS